MLCNVCGNKANAVDVTPDAPRESMRCSVCNATSRNRLLVHALGRWTGNQGPIENWVEDKRKTIFEASGTGGYGKHLKSKYDYFNTQYEPEELSKPNFDERKYADLENLHYASNTIDIIITSDVFEHVRLHRKAFKEIWRVLKPGGLFLLQMPYTHAREKTITRVDIQDGKDVYILPPVYHASHTLVYRDYGREVLSELHDDGFTVGHLEVSSTELQIPKQSILFCVKEKYLELRLC